MGSQSIVCAVEPASSRARVEEKEEGANLSIRPEWRRHWRQRNPRIKMSRELMLKLALALGYKTQTTNEHCDTLPTEPPKSFGKKPLARLRPPVEASARLKVARADFVELVPLSRPSSAAQHKTRHDARKSESPQAEGAAATGGESSGQRNQLKSREERRAVGRPASVAGALVAPVGGAELENVPSRETQMNVERRRRRRRRRRIDAEPKFPIEPHRSSLVDSSSQFKPIFAAGRRPKYRSKQVQNNAHTPTRQRRKQQQQPGRPLEPAANGNGSGNESGSRNRARGSSKSSSKDEPKNQAAICDLMSEISALTKQYLMLISPTLIYFFLILALTPRYIMPARATGIGSPQSQHQQATPSDFDQTQAAMAAALATNYSSKSTPGMGPDSPDESSFSRAVLATMSTQASPTKLFANQSVAAGPGQAAESAATQAARLLDDSSDKFSSEFYPTTAASAGTHTPAPHSYPPLEPAAPADVWEKLLSFLRIFIMSAIIIGDICGNSLVILSVCRHSKLRVTTNWFVVSLACADILVALFAMTFNASVIISGRWLFQPWVCDFWNSCDVLASTASILHLCCISIDRYIAIMRPLDYPMKITTKRVVYILCAVWISSALLSYLPIFTGVYTTAEHIEWLKENPDQCEFVVNRVYAIVSSSISFWIPCCIMVFVYYRIYREATRQEKFIYKAQSMMPAPMPNHHQNHHHSNSGNHHHHSSSAARQGKQRRSKSVAVGGGSLSSGGSASISQLSQQQQQQKQRQQLELATVARPVANQNQAQSETQKQASLNTIATTNLTVASSTSSIPEAAATASDALLSKPLQAPGNPKQAKQLLVPTIREEPASDCSRPAAASAGGDQYEDDDEDSNSGQSTPTKRSISKMKREHKAAKTLGIIMGVFILCWLPFFSWYTPTQICGRACDTMIPRQAVTILFWIGYFNSTLNPIIYAYFNHEFRDAFKKTLQWIFCCCQDLKCLKVNRPNDNQHYNCTYRSTQEIGLVKS